MTNKFDEVRDSREIRGHGLTTSRRKRTLFRSVLGLPIAEALDALKAEGLRLVAHPKR